MKSLFEKTYRHPLTSLFAVILISVVLFSCKKETTEQVTAFNPVGYWRGNAAQHHTAILNKSDGTSRIYFRIFGVDTAGATIGDGTYTVTGNSFKATYLIKNNPISFFIDARPGQADVLAGQLFNSTTPDIVDCTLRKQ